MPLAKLICHPQPSQLAKQCYRRIICRISISSSLKQGCEVLGSLKPFRAFSRRVTVVEELLPRATGNQLLSGLHSHELISFLIRTEMGPTVRALTGCSGDRAGSFVALGEECSQTLWAQGCLSSAVWSPFPTCSAGYKQSPGLQLTLGCTSLVSTRFPNPVTQLNKRCKG